MRYWPLLLALIAAPLLGSCGASDRPLAPRADHHVHIRSEAGTDALLRIQKELGQAPPDSIVDQMPSQTRAEDIVALLDSARIEQAALLSIAYFFGNPDVDFQDERAKVRAENDYVANQAAQYPDRLVAFCSVNPLADYALDEIERCARAPNLEGLKLHLANSDVDLRDASDAQQLADVFAVANRHELPIVVHLWTRHPDYGREDAEIFLEEVLPEAPDVPVQVAHLGGPGPYGEPTEGALQAFGEALEQGDEAMDNVLFDVGAVAVNPAQAEGDSAQVEQIRQVNQRIAEWVQTLGTDRVLFGSDHFARPIPGYVETMRSLPLEEETLRDLFDNTAPYLR